MRYGVMETLDYRLYTVVPKLVDFISQLTNWYVRLNRARIKVTNGKSGNSLMNIGCSRPKRRIPSIIVSFHSVGNLMSCHGSISYTRKLILNQAPFTPFFVEYVYQGLRTYLPASQREDCTYWKKISYLLFSCSLYNVPSPV